MKTVKKDNFQTGFFKNGIKFPRGTSFSLLIEANQSVFKLPARGAFFFPFLMSFAKPNSIFYNGYNT